MEPLSTTGSSVAPWFLVPDTDIMSIEHPCIIKNTAKAIDMLGGAQQLAQSLEQGTKQSISLNFKPNDPASRTVLSLHHETTNLLLKVTIPKRTGRKRKRGSNTDFVQYSTDSSTAQDASNLLKDLRNIPQMSTVEVVGNIKSCHVWRNIPDFVYFSKPSSFLHNIEADLLPQQYPYLKRWSLPRTYGLQDTEIIPPPVFSTQSVFHNYTYRQNPAVKAISDPVTGNKVLHNPSMATKLHMQIMLYDDAKYPTAPSPSCPSLDTQPKHIQDLVETLRLRFEERPIWTRRALTNSLPPEVLTFQLGTAATYVCYSLRSGPWRDAYVQFGVDPRKDPKYRKYQTILLRLALRGKSYLRSHSPLQRIWSRSDDVRSHIFTGDKAAAVDGKTWQLCDLEDPDLKELVDLPDLYLRPECEIRYFGWYANGTSAKLRILLKAKVDALAEGKELDSSRVKSFSQLPETWLSKAKSNGSVGLKSGYMPEGSSPQELEWASAYRSICRTTAGGLPLFGGNGRGRVNKPKPKARPSYLGAAEASPEEQELDLSEAEGEVEVEEEVQNDAQIGAAYGEPEGVEEDFDVADDDEAEI